MSVPSYFKFLSGVIKFLPRKVTRKYIAQQTQHSKEIVGKERSQLKSEGKGGRQKIPLVRQPFLSSNLKLQEIHDIKVYDWTFAKTKTGLFNSNRSNLFTVYFSLVDQLLEAENLNMTSQNEKYFRPPSCVKGMEILDIEAFNCQCEVPGFKVPVKSINAFKKIFKSKQMKRYKINSIVNFDESDPLAKTHKWCLLNPTKVRDLADLNENELEFVKSCLEDVKLEWTSIDLTYENFTAPEIVRAIVPDDIDENISAYSTIGHIAHVNLKEEVLKYKHIMGQVILDKNPCIKTVVNKLGTIDNTFRNFQMELLAGEDNYVTQVRENDCVYELDFSKVYWNSRLGLEHQKLSKQLKRGDVLYDVFAGVGPFAVPAAKRGANVLANDLNPSSYESLIKNKTLNKIKTEFQTFNMDGREFIEKIMREDLIKRLGSDSESKYINSSFHVAMNLPAIAIEFLDAFKGLLSNATELDKIPKEEIWAKLPTVHCYCFSKCDDSVTDVRERAEVILGMALPSKNEVRFVRDVAPNKNMMCLTFKLYPDLVFWREDSIKDEPDAKKQKIHEVYG